MSDSRTYSLNGALNRARVVHWGKGREGIGREEEGSSLLTFANADTRERAVNGLHASDSLPPNAPRRDAGKAKALTRWAG